MNLHQFFLLLRARRKLILSTLLATILLALGWSLVQSKTYTATTSVLLNYKGVDPLTGLTTVSYTHLTLPTILLV